MVVQERAARYAAEEVLAAEREEHEREAPSEATGGCYFNASAWC